MAEPVVSTETPNPGDSQTTVTPPATTPVVNAVDLTEVERLRKEAEQARMRANQLEKEKEARDKADEEARLKRLEEENQYKELYEQEKAKREGLETEAEKKQREAEVAETKQKILGDYSDAVKQEAEEFGFDLTTTDEADVEAFKDKLEKINKRLDSKVSPNNPGTPTPQETLSGDALRDALHDDAKFHELVTKKFPGIKSMTNEK